MSERQTNKGKIKKVDLGQLTLDQYVQDIFNKHGITPDEYFETPQEKLEEAMWGHKELEGKYIFINGELYNWIEDKECDRDFYEVIENPDGTIEYFVSFYNGGLGLYEAIEVAFKNRKKI